MPEWVRYILAHLEGAQWMNDDSFIPEGDKEDDDLPFSSSQRQTGIRRLWVLTVNALRTAVEGASREMMVEALWARAARAAKSMAGKGR